MKIQTLVPVAGDHACSGGAPTLSLTIYGSVPGSSPTRYVFQNPSTSGDYEIWVVYDDGTSDSAMVTIT